MVSPAFSNALDATWRGPARCLTALDALAWDPIAPDPDPRSGRRGHLARLALATLGMEDQDTTQALVSRGVRASLGLVFDCLARARHRVGLPTDVYPVYHALAQEAGLATLGYAARAGVPLDWFSTHPGTWLLVCDPLRPWGGRLDAAHWAQLVEQARVHRGGLIVDGAGQWDVPPALRRHLREGAPVAWLGSLSRDYLLPYCAGVALAPPDWARAWRPRFVRCQDPPDPWRLAASALSAHAHRPARVVAALARSRHVLVARLRERGISSRDPGHGYFLVSEEPPETLAALGVSALAASAFGSLMGGSVLSSLSQLGPITG